MTKKAIPFVIVLNILILASCITSPNLIKEPKSSLYVPISAEEAKKMIEGCSDTCSPQKITFKPAFLAFLNVYKKYHTEYVPAMYLTEEHARRYQQRWEVAEADDELWKVVNFATVLVKISDDHGNVLYYDEAGICPPPDNCKFPVKIPE